MVQDEVANFDASTLDELIQTCPLMTLPEKDNGSYLVETFDAGYAEGWNACIDEITGGE